MPRLSFLAGLGVGYVLGARAGRERYESIVRSARAFAERPEVQEAAGLVAAQAGTLLGRGGRRTPARVLDGAGSRIPSAHG